MIHVIYIYIYILIICILLSLSLALSLSRPLFACLPLSMAISRSQCLIPGVALKLPALNVDYSPRHSAPGVSSNSDRKRCFTCQGDPHPQSYAGCIYWMSGPSYWYKSTGISRPRIGWKQANTNDLDTFEQNIWKQKPVVNMKASLGNLREMHGNAGFPAHQAHRSAKFCSAVICPNTSTIQTSSARGTCFQTAAWGPLSHSRSSGTASCALAFSERWTQRSSTSNMIKHGYQTIGWADIPLSFS